MSILLPAEIPTKCTFTPAKIATKEGRLFESAISTKPLGNLPYGSMLELEYTNVDDSVALAFLKAYRNTFNRMFPVTINSALVTGITNVSLANRIMTPLGLAWFFKEGPEVESVIAGVSSFSIVLEALIIATPPSGGSGPSPTRPQIEVLVNPSSAHEGNPLTFIFNRSGDTSSGLVVNYTASGTATENVDYTGLPAGVNKSILIGAEASSESITIDTIADVDEGETAESADEETVIITVSPSSSYTRAPDATVATGIIQEVSVYIVGIEKWDVAWSFDSYSSDERPISTFYGVFTTALSPNLTTTYIGVPPFTYSTTTSTHPDAGNIPGLLRYSTNVIDTFSGIVLSVDSDGVPPVIWFTKISRLDEQTATGPFPSSEPNPLSLFDGWSYIPDSGTTFSIEGLPASAFTFTGGYIDDPVSGYGSPWNAVSWNVPTSAYNISYSFSNTWPKRNRSL